MKEDIKIVFKDNWYKPNDIIELNNTSKLVVLSNPKRKWYKLLFQIITFGLYKAPYEYKCKILK